MILTKMIFFGHHGAGKTVLLGTGAGDDRVWPGLFLDFEGGTDSIESKVKDCDIKDLGSPVKGKYDVVHIRSWDHFEDAFAVLNDPNDTQNVYKAVFVDSLTEINYLNLRRAVVQAIARERRDDKFTPQLQDYNRSGSELKYIFRAFRDLPIHCFFTALGHEDKDEITGATIVTPSLIGKLAEEIPGLVKTVGYIRAKRVQGEIKRECVFQPDGKIRAKDRSEGGKLGDIMEDPTLPEILDLLEVPHTEEKSLGKAVRTIKTLRRQR